MKSKYYSPRWWDFPAALLLIAAMLSSGTRLVATDWTIHLSLIQTLVFFGLIAGLLLGYSQFSARTAAFMAIIIGTFAIPWQLGTTVPVEYTWLERMVILINRLQVILSQLVFREPVRDSLLFLVVMFVLYWYISIYAGYALTRHGDAWLAILPGGLAMFVIHSFDPAISSRVWYLAAYLFFGLILVARMSFVHHQSQWQQSRTALPPHISLDFIRYTILAAFIVVMFAWTMPALAKALPQANRAWQPVRKAWNESVNNFENAFASLKATVFTYTAVYSPTSSLGRGSILTDAQVFRATAPLDLPTVARLYWRARVYDTYENGQWQTTFEATRDFNPQIEELEIDPGVGRWQGSFSIVSAANITTLFTPAQPLWVSRPGNLEYLQNPDGTIDVATFSADPSLAPGESYDILASISVPSAQELRESGTNYPEWVLERYLQLPSSITPRTHELARQITAGIETPYDKAVAVTEYLRNNIQYVEVLDEAPPSNQEPMDWFLFESKAGFCNYYSSAEIVLLRSLGIPARWAVGYAEGDLLDDEMTGFTTDEFTYIVRQRDAHAWPEVYFPGYGWVEFEPTVSQPDIPRQENAENQNGDSFNTDEELAALAQDKREQLEMLRNARNELTPVAPATSPAAFVGWGISLAAGIALLLFSLRYLPAFGLPTFPSLLAALFVRVGITPPQRVKSWAERAELAPKPRSIQLSVIPRLLEKGFGRLGIRAPKFIQRWARQAELPPLSKAYLEINRGLSLFGKSPAATDTPTERASALSQILPPAETPAKELVSQYQIGTFSNQPVDLDLARKSASTIRSLAYKAYLKHFFERFQKPDPARKQFRKISKNGRKPEG